MTELREKMKFMINDASTKESHLKQLKYQHESMKKDVNR